MTGEFVARAAADAPESMHDLFALLATLADRYGRGDTGGGHRTKPTQ